MPSYRNTLHRIPGQTGDCFQRNGFDCIAGLRQAAKHRHCAFQLPQVGLHAVEQVAKSGMLRMRSRSTRLCAHDMPSPKSRHSRFLWRRSPVVRVARATTALGLSSDGPVLAERLRKPTFGHRPHFGPSSVLRSLPNSCHSFTVLNSRFREPIQTPPRPDSHSRWRKNSMAGHPSSISKPPSTISSKNTMSEPFTRSILAAAGGYNNLS